MPTITNRLYRFSWTAIALSVALSSNALAGSIATESQLNSLLGAGGTLENFEALPVSNGGQLSDSGPLNSSTTFAGFGPGLVQPGATYSNGGSLYWNGNGYFDLVSRTLGDSNTQNSAGQGLSITYTAPVNAIGFDMQGYTGYSMQGTVSVFDTSNVLLATVLVNGGFFGWESAGGIGRIVVLATDPFGYILIDNSEYGLASVAPTPLPAALPLFATGLVGFGLFARRRRMRVA